MINDAIPTEADRARVNAELMGESEDSEQSEEQRHARDTQLMLTWRDTNGLLTGAIAYIRDNLRPGEDEYLHCDLPDDPWETSRQIGLFNRSRRASKTGGKPADNFEVSYQDFDTGHYVNITQYQATKRVAENAAPYQVFRPFIMDDGTVTYCLVREVKVVKHDVAATPMYLNYLLVKATGEFHNVLDDGSGFIDDAWYDMFLGVALGERMLRNFDTVPTEEKHRQWFQDFQATLKQFTDDTPWEVIQAEMLTFGERFKAITPEVVLDYTHNPNKDVSEETFEVDADLDDLDSSQPTHEVSMF